MPNDVPMFEHSGLSIAMGNASAEVQRAQYVTTSYEEEGFANAVERFILQELLTWRKEMTKKSKRNSQLVR